MDILFISDELIVPFKFWCHGQIMAGMHFRNELFGQVLLAPRQDRQRFFQLIEQFNTYASDIVITASRQRYIAWLNLRSVLSARLFSHCAFPVNTAHKAPV